ncbi:ParE family toxin-like protein [Escherichia coli]
MYRYRLLSLDEGRTWVLLNHNEYVKRIRRCYR